MASPPLPCSLVVLLYEKIARMPTEQYIIDVLYLLLAVLSIYTVKSKDLHDEK
jgi:hypothetical protein